MYYNGIFPGTMNFNDKHFIILSILGVMAKECVQCQLAPKYLAILVRILENMLRFTLPAPQKSEEQQLKGHCHLGFCRYFIFETL